MQILGLKLEPILMCIEAEPWWEVIGDQIELRFESNPQPPIG